MEKLITRKRCHQLWFSIRTTIFLCLALLSVDLLVLLCHKNGVIALFGQIKSVVKTITVDERMDADGCSGRYIYIQNLPTRFNHDLLQKCHLLSRGPNKPGTSHPNMCLDLVNSGFGPEIKSAKGVLSKKSWYTTNPYLTEVIFHDRMKKYECLTNNSSVASAIYVPYYAGLDLSQFLWDSNISVRDSTGKVLVRWLASRPEWKTMWGRDHFIVTGRTSWDFRRHVDNDSFWGSKFRFLPESNNMSMLSVEASLWNNDHAIPYPTHFHPSTESEVLQWQSKVRQQTRPYLFSFVGGPRPEDERSIRSKIIEQCRGSTSCRFFDCSAGKNICDNPVNVMQVFQKSVFCLQPPGDSYTRRSIFDSMIAGCIPVFFHPGTAYKQYIWHLPKNRTQYSVYIPIKDVKEWSVNLELELQGIAEENVVAMREEVIKLIPSIIYVDPGVKLVNVEDAFDLTLKGLLDGIDEVRKSVKEGRDPGIGFSEQNPMIYSFSE